MENSKNPFGLKIVKLSLQCCYNWSWVLCKPSWSTLMSLGQSTHYLIFGMRINLRHSSDFVMVN